MKRNYYELSARFDARKSFYGKALVSVEPNGDKALISYGHEVVRIRNGNVALTTSWDASDTTIRHVKEFLKQEGVSIGSYSKKEIAEFFKDKIEEE
jgi:hypothetical protein